MTSLEKEYVFVIYSCKKNLHKANAIYDRFHTQIEDEFNMKMLILYGDNLSKKKVYEIKEEKYLILNVEDGYEFLDLKSLKLFKTIVKIFPNIKGCFKCDDDVVLNLSGLTNFLILLNTFPIDYSGFSSIRLENDNKNRINHHINSKNIKTTRKIKSQSAIYCGGPLYYLSKKSLECIDKTKYTDVQDIFYEDLMIGRILNQHSIFPLHCNLYNDDFKYFNKELCSYHNNDHKNILFIRTHGGLGNQMFQIASGLSIAQKNNMIEFIINSSNVCKQDFTHTTDNNKLFDTIFYALPNIKLENIRLNNVKKYKETDADCFTCNDIILKEDTFLDGYFQNEKYFKEHKNKICHIFKQNNAYQECYKNVTDNKTFAALLKNTYFIHVRRGDYVNHPLHQIDYDSYFPKAISYILEKDKDAHFYIVSDDIEYCKTYPVLDNINKTFLESVPELETLYFMSFCWKGGICSNSTFSWWGSYLNENPDKIVVFPSKWLNNNSPNDIYYENSVVIDV
jgi:hypothetical protein